MSTRDEIEEKRCGIRERIQAGGSVLIGIGGEWKQNPGKEDEEKLILREEVERAYDSLYQLIKDRDYFVITTVTDGQIWKSPLDPKRIAAPCGNIGWRQCAKACTKDIWEEGEIPDGICPHCGSLLVPNTIRCGCYIEEGYLPQWEAYTRWLSRTLNHPLTVLELGEGFALPTVIRWPFEKTVFLNQKAYLYRVHSRFSQISGEVKEKGTGIAEDSVEFINGFWK